MQVNGYEIKPRADLRGTDLYGADLRGANLRGANLCGANLCGANLRGAVLPEQAWAIYGEEFFVFVHKDSVRFGCQVRTVKEWLALDDTQINALDGAATKFAARGREIIEFYCKEYI